MTTMISEVYSAFRKAGVPEDDAKLAAEALSKESMATKGDIRSLSDGVKAEITKLEKELLIIKWMLGLIIAIQVIPIPRSILT